MNAEIVQRLIENSDNYSAELFGRFVNNEFGDATSSKLLSQYQRMLESEGLGSETAHAQSADSEDELLGSFFLPGATDDVFINYHPPFLNGWAHTHEFFELIYVNRGEAVDWIDGVEVNLKAGELCIHNPNAVHKILRMDPQTSLVVNVLLPVELFQRVFYSWLLENEELDRFFNSYLVSSDTNENYMAFHNTSQRVDTIMELLVEEFLRHENSSRFVMESTLAVLFGELLRTHKTDPLMRDLVSYILSNMGSVTLKGAADHFGYHPNYFPSVVRRHCNRTFWDLVTDLRIQRACNLLLHTNRTVEQISLEVGYRSTASLYEHFYQSLHMRPAEYRRKGRAIPKS